MTRCARIYIAGPMSGLPNLNFDAFHDAADRFRRAAWIVENPVEIGREVFGPRPDAVSAHRFLQADMRRLIDCDAIALLPGWERSVGASAEAAMALALGLTFYDAETAEEISRPTCLTVRSYAAPAPETEETP